MRNAIIILLIILAIITLLPNECEGQMRKVGKKVKKIDCPIEDKKDVNYSMGIRVGDPYGITAKVYFPKRWGIELIAGRTFPGLHEQANEEVFSTQIELPYDQTDYLGHQVNKLYTAQFRLIYHVDIQSFEGLDWYIAIGAQSRYYEVHYVYEYTNNSPFISDVTSLDEPYLQFGPEVSIGIEYVIPYRRLSSFAEIGAFADTHNETLNSQFMGALGVRFNF